MHIWYLVFVPILVLMAIMGVRTWRKVGEEIDREIQAAATLDQALAGDIGSLQEIAENRDRYSDLLPNRYIEVSKVADEYSYQRTKPVLSRLISAWKEAEDFGEAAIALAAWLHQKQYKNWLDRMCEELGFDRESFRQNFVTALEALGQHLISLARSDHDADALRHFRSLNGTNWNTQLSNAYAWVGTDGLESPRDYDRLVASLLAEADDSYFYQHITPSQAAKFFARARRGHKEDASYLLRRCELNGQLAEFVGIEQLSELEDMVFSDRKP